MTIIHIQGPAGAALSRMSRSESVAPSSTAAGAQQPKADGTGDSSVEPNWSTMQFAPREGQEGSLGPSQAWDVKILRACECLTAAY